MTLGLIAGFMGGIVDSVISFMTDLFLTFPFLVMALAISPILNDRFGDDTDKLKFASFYSLVAILVVFGWMGVARLVRGEVLSLREREFVKAARVIGVPTHRILIREMLPNLIAPIVISFSLGLPAYVAAEAGLSFLGIGVFGRESWGQTIAAATPWWERYPLYLLEPVLGIADSRRRAQPARRRHPRRVRPQDSTLITDVHIFSSHRRSARSDHGNNERSDT